MDETDEPSQEQAQAPMDAETARRAVENRWEPGDSLKDAVAKANAGSGGLLALAGVPRPPDIGSGDDPGAGANPPAPKEPIGYRISCRRIPYLPGGYFVHCYVTNTLGQHWGLHGDKDGLPFGHGQIQDWNGFDEPRIENDDIKHGEWVADADTHDKVMRAIREYPQDSAYDMIKGPNSNTFAKTVAEAANLKRPPFGSPWGWCDTPGPYTPPDIRRGEGWLK